MRRRGIAVALLVVCVVAGVLFAFAPAVVGPASAGPSATSTTAPTTTTPPQVEVIPADVTVGGVPVGGLTPQEAYAAVREAFERPLVVLLGRRKLVPTPEQLGAVAYALGAVERAKTAPAGTHVPLQIAVNGGKVRAYVATLAKSFDRAPVDARLFLRGLRPSVSKDQPGRKLDRPVATRLLVSALIANRKGPIRLESRPIRPEVTRRSIGPVLVIRRGSNRLLLYQGSRPRRSFGVATGQSVYPTPLGRFTVLVKWRDPWWYPPDSDWAQGQAPIPPGPGNPLGTRWMGLSAPGVGIHGTPDDTSIGYSVSHGCIRMHIPDAEWLFDRIRIGTTVFIVAA